MIERLQPYYGCDWSKRLHRFSNRDKHNGFVAIQAQAIIETNPIIPRGPTTFVFRAIHPPTSVEVNVNIHVTVEIFLGKSLPVVQTLKKIKSGVAQTLADFNPEFP
jgi:hypothetical protein